MPISVLLLLLAPAAVPEPIEQVSWFSANDYPTEAVYAGIEGTVEYQVQVDENGKASACEIIRTSGHPALDKATCDSVMLRARFRPVKKQPGQEAAVFKSKVRWQVPRNLPGVYRATTVEFGEDGAAPACSIIDGGMSPDDEIGCDQLLAQTELMAKLSQRFRKVTWLTASADTGIIPFRGEPNWGERVSFLANEQVYLKGPYPVACIHIAAEGWLAGGDGCETFPFKRRVLAASELFKARKMRVETSIFALKWTN